MKTTSKRSIEIPGYRHRAPIPMAARVGNLLFSSAISGIDPATGEPGRTAEEQVRLVFAHLHSLLTEAGATLAEIARVSIHVHDNSIRELINAHWLQTFPDPDDRPARHIEVHPLPVPLCLQVEIVAVLPQQGEQ